MIKKIVAFLLAVTMLACSICSVSAATMSLNEFLAECNGWSTDGIVNVPIYIEGKLSSGTYANSITGSKGNTADFHAVLDMTNVKNAVSLVFTMGASRLSDTDMDALRALPVTGQFTIRATWSGVTAPADIATGNLSGFSVEGAGNNKTIGNFFSEGANRTVTANSMESTISVKDSVKAEDLLNLPDKIILEKTGFTINSNGQMLGEISATSTVIDAATDYTVAYTFMQESGRVMTVPIRVSGPTGGGGSSITKYTLSYQSNGGTEYAAESYAKGKTVDINKIPVREGYVFDGWYEDAELTKEVTSITITENTAVYAKWVKERPPVPEMLNGVDHFAYVIGYPDGTVRPNDNITRAEVTTIFFRLLKDEVRAENLIDENIFDDVNAEDWHNLAISTMAKLGIVNGRASNMFAPDEFITRAEFTTICARFEDLEVESNNNFTDIDEHWAKANILEAAAYGWIEGYEDNTFRPDEYITRAEAMTLINRVLNRVHKDYGTLLEGMATWSDNSDESAWYYTAVQEATNSNEYEHINSVYKKWTKLMENRDWSEYQK